MMSGGVDALVGLAPLGAGGGQLRQGVLAAPD